MSKDRSRSPEEQSRNSSPGACANHHLGPRQAVGGEGILMATPLTTEKDSKHRGTPVPRAPGMTLGDCRGSRAIHSRGHGERTSFLFFSCHYQPHSDPSSGCRRSEAKSPARKNCCFGGADARTTPDNTSFANVSLSHELPACGPARVFSPRQVLPPVKVATRVFFTLLPTSRNPSLSLHLGTMGTI